ncbi:Mannose-6-phosphate isomerase [Melia azedarach]|uniref:Mannose-6-phosphate isomerase n=1 Tax=Melia azedarach TaxID=155640 RepID=A0ACC1Y2X7_MELAZ|nr:Mannose-6-phosphate isomerase [Melia azedarach]
MANINLCCSIEMEPKTLSEVQLNHAREVAAYVVQELEPKEASIIFIKGLEPVEVDRDKEEKAQDFLKPVESNAVVNVQKTTTIEKPCQCSLIKVNNVVAPPDDEINLKGPLSAPF